MVGTATVTATAATRRRYHASIGSTGAVDAISFPSIPAETDGGELRVREGANLWSVPFSLAPPALAATPLSTAITAGGVVVRATARTSHAEELIVELEVEAATQIRQVAAPLPSLARLPTDTEEDRRERSAEIRRLFGADAQPITLVDDRGGTHEEVRRLFWHEPQQTAPGGPFTSRFSVVFDAPGAEVRRGTLVVPFVELNDFGPSTTVDLRALPVDAALGERRFRVVAVEPHGTDQRRMVLELSPSTASPRFVQPARVQGSGPEFGWQRHALDAAGPGRQAIWMATRVGDPPIVTFTGVVLRVDGPLRLDLELQEG